MDAVKNLPLIVVETEELILDTASGEQASGTSPHAAPVRTQQTSIFC
jgi:hypothetical protein